MTSYLTHGVKAKMCETTPFVNTVGSHYVASRTQIDSLRQQGSSKVSTIGLSKVDVCASTTLTESPSCTIAEALFVPKTTIWSTMVMHTSPFHSDILQNLHPHHEVLLSCKPHRPGCHQWRPLQPQVHDDVKDFQPDVIVERYLDAMYYQYDPEEIYDVCGYNCNATYLAESDQVVTLTAMETDESSMLASIHDNLRELETSVPEWEKPSLSIPNGQSTISPDTLLRIWDVQFVWRKQAARSIILNCHFGLSRVQKWTYCHGLVMYCKFVFGIAELQQIEREG